MLFDRIFRECFLFEGDNQMLRAALTMIILLFFASPGISGGPLEFNATGPVVMDTSKPIVVKMDRGDLKSFSGKLVRQIVRSALLAFEKVPTAKISFRTDTLLAKDIKTIAEYLPLETAGENVIVFDKDGSILEDLVGKGQNDSILGWASPVPDDTSNPKKIKFFYSLLNGKILDNTRVLHSTVLHELGHAIGLDHSQIHASYAGDRDGKNDMFIPTMFPNSTDDDSYLSYLNPDDRAWLSKLYPNRFFQQAYGTIKGRLVRVKDGVKEPVLGVNIIAINTKSTHARQMHRYSTVSDWLAANDGFFEIPARPGSYELRIQPIERSFMAGSSVGPHAGSSSGKSFNNGIDQEKVVGTTHVVESNKVLNLGDVVVN
jgi:hypothetical protein